MPLGRLVLSRIVKIVGDASGDPAKKRFNLSCRRSLAVYGTNAVDKSSL
jgi:hypothetical protein